MPHTMFSFSKVITAIAIGFAINEGLLRLDTSIEELFGDSYSEKLISKNEGVNVRNLLNMTADAANKMLLNSNLNVKITGATNGSSATVISQSPAAGTEVEVGTIVQFELRHMDVTD